MEELRELRAVLTIDIGSKPCASWKPPKRSMRLPADCTAEKIVRTRRPRPAPMTTSPTSAITNAPSLSDSYPGVTRGATAMPRATPSIALMRAGMPL